MFTTRINAGRARLRFARSHADYLIRKLLTDGNDVILTSMFQHGWIFHYTRGRISRLFAVSAATSIARFTTRSMNIQATIYTASSFFSRDGFARTQSNVVGTIPSDSKACLPSVDHAGLPELLRAQ